MENYLLILAGGKGNRLWPISTEKKPKQFINLYGSEIMINETVRRVENIFKYENIFIIINEEQLELAHRYVDNKIPRENIITEPKMRNTAMCIFLATLRIKKMRGDGVISILSSDHYIENVDKLQKNILDAIEIAKNDGNIVTIGIEPTYPATGFGYIKYDKSNGKEKYYLVKEFKEKPDYDTATKFLSSNQYVWNSGMFIWKIETILSNFEKYLPNIYVFKNTLYDSFQTDSEQGVTMKIYEMVEPISIDKGILEKSNLIKMIKADFKWMDIGSVKDFFEVHSKDCIHNVIIGNAITRNIENVNIYNNTDELLVTIGVDNISVIKNNNVCVICNSGNIDEISKMHEEIKNQEEYKKFM